LWDEDVGSGLRSKAQEEDISDAAYEKRHRKHELAEKKLKNRERERLAYERYQQQLAVEKLRNTDSKSLISVAALRNNDATNDASKLETVHKKLLKEAEDTLARYDSLGLGGKKRKTDVSSNNTEGESKVTEEPECKKIRLRGSRRTSNANSDDVPSKMKAETPIRVTRSRKRNEKQSNENNVNKTITIKKSVKALPRAKKVRKSITSSSIDRPSPTLSTHQRVVTFIKPNTAMPSGLRKSSRSALAFGHRIPTKSLTKRDFTLPIMIFGEMMRERENLRLIEYQQQLEASKEYDALMEKSTK
ncbi:18888_t:CDS:2, partial [Acaulospora morrowiae]